MQSKYSVNEVFLYSTTSELPVTLSRSEGSRSALNERFFASLRMTNQPAKTLQNVLYGILRNEDMNPVYDFTGQGDRRHLQRGGRGAGRRHGRARSRHL